MPLVDATGGCALRNLVGPARSCAAARDRAAQWHVSSLPSYWLRVIQLVSVVVDVEGVVVFVFGGGFGRPILFVSFVCQA